MSRNALWQSLVDDPRIGLPENHVVVNYNNDERPSETSLFTVLRWGTTDAPRWQSVKSPENLTVWAHFPKDKSNDYNRLINFLDNVDEVFKELRDVVGTDGYTLSFVQIGGRGPDLVDDVLNTITKYSEYQVFSRKS
jgi:hypothetical protein